MKLLLDQNLSYRLCEKLKEISLIVNHVKEFSLDKADDEKIWEFSIQNDFIIVTKDSDFIEKAIIK